MREWPHEKEQCMKTFAFERWCDRLQLPTATRDFLLRLRSSPPVRRVQGRLLNVCETYASRKMGMSIQFESHTVELWAIYTMEYDREVLEFFDQPYQLELHYQGELEAWSRGNRVAHASWNAEQAMPPGRALDGEARLEERERPGKVRAYQCRTPRSLSAICAQPTPSRSASPALRLARTKGELLSQLL